QPRRLAMASVVDRDAASAGPGRLVGRRGGVLVLRHRIRHGPGARRTPVRHHRDRDLYAHHGLPRPAGRGGAVAAAARTGGGAADRLGAVATTGGAWRDHAGGGAEASPRPRGCGAVGLVAV